MSKQIKEISIRATTKGGREATQIVQTLEEALTRAATSSERFESQFTGTLNSISNARSQTRGLVSSLNGLNDSISAVSTNFRNMESGLDSSINGIIESFDLLVMSLENVKRISGEVGSDLENITQSAGDTEGLDRMQTTLEEISESLRTLNETIGGLVVGQLEELEQKSFEQVEALAALREGMDDLDDSTQRTTKALKSKAEVHESGAKSIRHHQVEVAKFTNDTRRLSGAGSQQARAFSDLAFKMNPLVTTYAKIAVNVYALSEAFRVLSNAANLDRLENQTANFSAALTGINIRQVGRDLERMTGYALETGEALSAVVRLSSLEFTRDEIEQLAFQMRKASLATGVEFGQAVERAIRGVSALRTEVFQQLGLFVNLEEAIGTYRLAVGMTSNQELTEMQKRQALLNAVLSESERRFGAFDATATPLEQLKVGVSNFLDTTIKAVANGLNPLIGRTTIYSQVLGRAVTSNQKAAESLDTFNQAIASGNIAQAVTALHSYSTAMEDIRNNVGAYGETGEALEERLAAQERLQRMFNVALGVGATYVGAIAGMYVKKLITAMSASYVETVKNIAGTKEWIKNSLLKQNVQEQESQALEVAATAMQNNTAAATANSKSKVDNAKTQTALVKSQAGLTRVLAEQSVAFARHTTEVTRNTLALRTNEAAAMRGAKAKAQKAHASKMAAQTAFEEAQAAEALTSSKALETTTTVANTSATSAEAVAHEVNSVAKAKSSVAATLLTKAKAGLIAVTVGLGKAVMGLVAGMTLMAAKVIAVSVAVAAVVHGVRSLVSFLKPAGDSTNWFTRLMDRLGSVVRWVGRGFEYLFSSVSKITGLDGIAEELSGTSATINPLESELAAQGLEAIDKLAKALDELENRSRGPGLSVSLEGLESATNSASQSVINLTAEEAQRVEALEKANERLIAGIQQTASEMGSLAEGSAQIEHYEAAILRANESLKENAKAIDLIKENAKSAAEETEKGFTGALTQLGISLGELTTEQAEEIEGRFTNLVERLQKILGVEIDPTGMSQIIQELSQVSEVSQSMQRIVAGTRRTRTPLQQLQQDLQTVSGQLTDDGNWEGGLVDGSLLLGSEQLMQVLRGLEAQGGLTAEAIALMGDGTNVKNLREAFRLTTTNIADMNAGARRFAASMHDLERQAPLRAMRDESFEIVRAQEEQVFILEKLTTLVGTATKMNGERVESVEELLRLSTEELQNIQGINAETITTLSLQAKAAEEREKVAKIQRELLLAERQMQLAIERNSISMDGQARSRESAVKFEIEQLKQVKAVRKANQLSTEEIEHQIALLELRRQQVAAEEAIELNLIDIRNDRAALEAKFDSAGSARNLVSLRQEAYEVSKAELDLIVDVNQREERKLELQREALEIRREAAAASARDVATSASAIASLQGLTSLQATAASSFASISNVVGDFRFQLEDGTKSFTEFLKQDLQAFANFASSILSVTQGVFAEISASRVASLDREIEAEKRRDGQSEESLNKIKQLEAKKIKEEGKSKKASVAMSTATAVMQAFAQMGPIVGAPFAAAMGLIGMKQISQINRAMNGQLAALDSGGTGLSLGSGSRGNGIDISKRANAGELAFLSGERGSGRAGNFTPGRAVGGYASAGTRITVGESGPEEIIPEMPVKVKSAGESGEEKPIVFAPVFNASAIDTRGMEALFKDYSRELYKGLEKEFRAKNRNLNAL